MQLYHITTKERVYNHVKGNDYFDAKAQFQIIRNKWNDTSKVTRAFRWYSDREKWIKVNSPLNW